MKNIIIAGVCGNDPRFSLESFMPEAESAFVICKGYGKRHEFETDRSPRGLFSEIAVGTDYHITMRETLSALDDELRKLYGEGYKSKIHVDAGPLPERLMAATAGLGYIGKNGCLITEKFGSLCNIGCLVTNIKIKNSARYASADECENCELCVAACPGGALNNSFDKNKCISCLTQTKRPLTEEEKRLIGISLYGCDICQNVCPKNKGKHVDVITDIDAIMPPLEFILNMTDDEYEKHYAGSSIYWRGLEILKRNAAIALNNIRKKGEA